MVRHGESAGNVARDRALAEGLAVIDIAPRDVDVPLSRLGERQSQALGRWLGAEEPAPDAVFASPYVRAQQSARLALEAAKWTKVPVLVDERLREKEFGMLDRLTRTGILERFPEQAEMRQRVGKFYYRPPGGESWTDVVLRLRTFVETLKEDYANARILIVSHQVIVLCFRYILERLSEREILDIDAASDVANCAVTRFCREERSAAEIPLHLVAYNEVAPLERAGERVTRGADVPAGPK